MSFEIGRLTSHHIHHNVHERFDPTTHVLQTVMSTTDLIGHYEYYIGLFLHLVCVRYDVLAYVCLSFFPTTVFLRLSCCSHKAFVKSAPTDRRTPEILYGLRLCPWPL